MVEAEEVQDGGVEVAVVVGVLDRAVADVVGGAMHEAALDAAAGEPRGVALGVVVSAGGVLGPRRAPEFAGPNDQGVIEHPALFEVSDESRNGPVGGAAERLMGLHVAVGIPSAVAPAGMANLDEADAALREPAREQQLFSELFGVPIVEAVH